MKVICYLLRINNLERERLKKTETEIKFEMKNLNNLK